MREVQWSSLQPPQNQVDAVVLYLHGGAVRSRKPVAKSALTFGRMRWMRDALAPSLAADGIASAALRHTLRGWNAKDGEPSPLADGRWALEEIRRRFDVPVVLVGHSMGARTGLGIVGHSSVVGLVALAPWFPADEDVSGLKDRHLAILHGTRDRVTSPRESSVVAQRSESLTASTSYLAMPGLGHYLLVDPAAWHRGARDAIRTIVESTRGASR